LYEKRALTTESTEVTEVFNSFFFSDLRYLSGKKPLRKHFLTSKIKKTGSRQKVHCPFLLSATHLLMEINHFVGDPNCRSLGGICYTKRINRFGN